MATYCALHVRTVDLGGVLDEVVRKLEEVRCASTAIERGVTFADAEWRRWGSGVMGPSWFALGATHDGWIAASHDDLSYLSPLAMRLSSRFDARVIAVFRQTTSDCYGVEIHEQGVFRRRLEQSDTTRDEGVPFDFERELEFLARRPIAIFDDEIQTMCGHLDLSLDQFLRPSPPPEDWTVVSQGLSLQGIARIR